MSDYRTAVSAIEITRLRGIREGKVEGLTPLTVLVGPNGCGKSTVLEALLLGVALNPAFAALHAITRRDKKPANAGWLLYRNSREGDATVLATTTSGRFQRVFRQGGTWGLYDFADLPPAARPEVLLTCEWQDTERQTSVASRLSYSGADGWDADSRVDARPSVTAVQFVDRLGADEDAESIRVRRFREAVRQGGLDTTVALLGDLVPGFKGLLLNTDEANEPVIDIQIQGGSIPLTYWGDGVRRMLDIALSLGIEAGGMVLVEEPETHLHPGAMLQAAAAIWAAVRAGVQVVLSTHSIEFIEMLVGHATDVDLEHLSVQSMWLQDGKLGATSRVGEQVEFSVAQMHHDLR